ncbi:glutathione S-transferase family protein [Cobetia amphilecti]|uniref:glutathione S-transferase family protein n=1 Tax=Cobetia amphilecti TaxID=1055104 RepID=UPI0026E15CA2|nr:glutathione S-transferase [Cobetia amphilecti]MDO6814953.1 glutathione S-transferase [Cobetia amphilecti]
MNPRFAATSAPIRLFCNPKSGHCHRVELMLALLDIPYETVELDMANGAHKAPEFLKISPFGQVPAIEDNGVFLSDSNAILVYLTQRYDGEKRFMPSDALAAAQVQRWLSVAAGEIAAGPCTARLVTVFGAPFDHGQAIARAHALFAVMESHLEQRHYLVGERLTLADIAGYSYIAHAPEGGVSLSSYPAIRGWLARIEAEPDFVGMATSPVMA